MTNLKHPPTRILALLAMGLVAATGFAQAPDLESMDIVEKSTPDGPVAIVGGKPISKQSFFAFYAAERDRVTKLKGEQLPDGVRVQLAMWCLGNLIEEELLYQEAQRRGLSTDAARVQSAWEGQLDQARALFKQRDDREYSDSELLTLLGYDNVDDALSDLRRSILIELSRMQIIRESNFEIPEDQIRAYYEENKSEFQRDAGYHIKRVFVEAPATDETLRSEGRTRAENAMTQIMSGKRFETVAGEWSDGPDKKVGGDVGTVAEKDLPPFYVEALKKMGPGDVTPILETQHGFHIVQLVEAKSGGQVSLEEATPIIRRRLRAEQSTQVVRDYCDALVRDHIPVNILLELEKNLSVAGARDGLALN
jgi:parvulin-like peptidyl-prolyl isomerase